MSAARLLLFASIISYIYPQQMSTIDSNSYGPYKVRWRYFELCSGPKRENLTLITKSLSVENEEYKGAMNLSFTGNTRIDEIKIAVSSYTDKHTKPQLWSYKINKPCQHYAIGLVFITHLNADSNCIVKKGDYNIIIDFTDVTHKFLGKSFFYGEYIFKSMVLSKKGNIACIVFNPIFSKD